MTDETEAQTRGRHENANLAIKAFELSQNLVAKWDRADFDAKRRLLEIVCLDLAFDGATLYLERRKLFDSLIEGLTLEKSRSDKTAIELFLAGISGWGIDIRSRIGLQKQFS